MLRSFMGIFRHEIRSLWQPALLWRVVLLYPAVLACAVVLSWPSAYPVEGGAFSATFLWWAYVNTYLLGSFVLVFSAQAGKGTDEILPHHWVQYVQAHPAAVLAAKLTGALVGGVLWLCVSLPSGVISGTIATPRPPLGVLFGYWLALAVPLSFVGVWLASIVAQQPLRAWAVRTFWPALLTAGKLWADGFGRLRAALVPWSPLSTVEALSRPESDGSFAVGLALQASGRMLLLAAAGAALAFATLKRWRAARPPAAVRRKV